MNLVLGTVLLFASILMLFFGVPIGTLALTSRIFPPNLKTPEPVKQLIQEEIIEPVEQPIENPIEVQQVYHKGYLVWVDA